MNKPTDFQQDIVAGLSEALRGWSKAKKPAAWDALQSQVSKSTDAKLRNRVRDLSVLFGDGRALDEVKRVALDDKVELSQRQAALETLIANKPADLRQICERLLTVRFLNSVAIRGLAQFDDPAIGEKLAGSYFRFHALERDAVLDTLTSRPTFARSLLKQMAAGKIPRQRRYPVLRAPRAQLQRSRAHRPTRRSVGRTARQPNRKTKADHKLESKTHSRVPCRRRQKQRSRRIQQDLLILPRACTATATTPVST